MKKFEERYSQMFDTTWDEKSGISEQELLLKFDELMKNENNLSKAMLKAKTFELIANNSRISIDKEDIFQYKLFDGNIILNQLYAWKREAVTSYMAEENEKRRISHDCGSHTANEDFGHTSPNTIPLLKLGVKGLIDRIEKAEARADLSEKQKDFYNSCKVSLNAFITYLKRLSDNVLPFNKENSVALSNLTKSAPENIYEAMQLLIAYFFFHEYVGKTRIRTLGRLDVLLYPFYKNDLENGTFTKDEIKEMLKFFLNRFWTAKVPFDLPFCLSGMDKDGNDVTNEISYLIVEAYNEINIHSPKIHIRVSEKTPKEFIKLVLNCIRGGNSSFVFVNDNVIIKSLTKVGIEETDAKNYVPIGCYEPAVWGVEIGCTGNGSINLAKALEFVITNGVDLRTGELCGVKTGEISTFDEFVSAIKEQIKFMTDEVIHYVTKIEGKYKEINPDPILSAMYDSSVEKGADLYEGSAKYNNSSINFMCIASLVDSICAVKKLVFDDKLVTFDQLCDILKNDWNGYEKLRIKAKNSCEKYGNGALFADSILVEFSDYIAKISNNRKNGRGGVFKASLFTIDHYVPYGERTMATPDGRKSGEILSKNLSATVGADKNGLTALINSVTKADMSNFPNGTVLDIILHPSAVSGDDGLEAFYGILMVFFKKGGFAMQGNVFSADTLKEAQKNPEKYKNLQVRVCGWNVFFVNLRKAEQDAFILSADSNMM